VKDLTGGDRISARFLYAEIFEYVPEFKIWMATNYKALRSGELTQRYGTESG